MVLFCPTCGEPTVKNANYCARCGAELPSTGATPLPPPVQQISAEVAKAEVVVPSAAISAESQTPTPPPPPKRQSTFFSVRMSNSFFWLLVGVLTVGVLAAAVLPVVAGHKPPGNQVGTMVLWLIILAYAVLRRGGRSRPMSLVLAVVAAFGIAVSIEFADRLVNRDAYTIDREWSKNKALATMKAVDPKAYDALRAEVLRVVRAEPESDGRTATISSRVSAAMQAYGQRTSDAALVNQYRGKHGHLKQLLNQDPALCYYYSWGIASPALSKMSDAIRSENLDLLSAVIASAGPAIRPVNTAQAESSLDRIFAVAEKRLGKESALMQALDKPTGDTLGTCKAMIAFSGSLIDTLSVPDAANVLRYMAQTR